MFRRDALGLNLDSAAPGLAAAARLVQVQIVFESDRPGAPLPGDVFGDNWLARVGPRFADVYFHASSGAAGDQITARAWAKPPATHALGVPGRCSKDLPCSQGVCDFPGFRQNVASALGEQSPKRRIRS